ncbi:MAG: hypothetical protein IPL01_22535 [Acidobacteria bacterium]|nr:hypothetical protein [Acidobacteriota bacterium]
MDYAYSFFTNFRLFRLFRILFFLFAIGIVGFFSLPYLMVAPAEGGRADVILHGAIDPHLKTDEYVARLFREGRAGDVLCFSTQVSWEAYPADYVARHLVELGVPADRVHVLHLPIEPCGAYNAPRVVDYLRSKGWKSAILITSPDSSRMAGWSTRKRFAKSGIPLIVSYAPEDREELFRGWWRTHWKIQDIVDQLMVFTLDQVYAECR